MTTLSLTDLPRLIPKVTAEEAVAADLLSRGAQLSIDIAVAAVIVVVTLWASRWAATLARGLVGRLSRHQPPDATLQTFVASLVRYLVIIVGGVAVLQQLGVKTTSILAVLGAASLAIGLAMQGALSNVAAGVLILALRPYRVGDIIEIGTRRGTVRALDLFVTEIATADNLKVVIPNGKVFADVIVNHSAHERRRADAVFRIPLSVELGPFMAALKARAAADPRTLDDVEPLVEITAMAEAWVEGAVRAWTLPHDHPGLVSDLTLAARLLAAGQELPPPPPPKVSRPKPAKGRKSGLGSLRSRLKGEPDRP
ncbi:MAG TPA: mechanosensitive ion channel domain-containing protein [Caulobacter sp.]|nr:mechanosensitive ion channel domain-containing protein [Caulobacter sp.]